MSQPILARESVLLRYQGTEAWVRCDVVDVWRAADVEEAQSDDPGSPYTSDLMRAAFLGLAARGLRVDTITRLVLGRTPFAVFRVEGRLVDCFGRPLEVQRG